MTRGRTAIFVIGAVIAAGIVGWLAGSSIESPADIAARTGPPEASLILARVERRPLSTTIVTRGTARFGSPQVLSLASSIFKEGQPGIVTSLPAPGTEIKEGQVLLTVSGRPVFLLGGAQPSYRDLGPGIAGEDVRQLEAALSRLGFDPGPIDGRFDGATAAAVATLYHRAGFEPVEATEEDLTSIRPLAAELVAGSRAEAGVQVPADEVLFAINPPVRVAERTVAVGDERANPLMTVTDAVVAIDGSLPLDEARLVTRGMRVQIDEPDLGIEASGVVSRGAAGPGTDGVDGFHVYFEIVVTGASATIVGASVRITVPVETTRGPVLAVPVSALSLSADGSTRVQKVARGNLVVVVLVDPGLSAAGFVEVTPKQGTLEPGDMVVIGYEQGSAAPLETPAR